MAVYHILRDGSRPTDITGRVVRLENDEPLYRLLHSIGRESNKNKNNTYKNKNREAIQ